MKKIKITDFITQEDILKLKKITGYEIDANKFETHEDGNCVTTVCLGGLNTDDIFEIQLWSKCDGVKGTIDSYNLINCKPEGHNRIGKLINCRNKILKEGVDQDV